MENRRSFLKLRQNKQIERQYDCYIEWIMKGGRLSFSKYLMTFKEAILDFSKQTHPKLFAQNPAISP